MGTERHPETVTPPVLRTPALPDLVALAVAFGTGRAVRDEGAVDGDLPPWEQTDAERLTEALGLVRQGADHLAARERLWAVLRDPLARLLNPVGGLSREGVDQRVSLAQAVAGLSGVSWDSAFATPAVEAFPEPKSWQIAS